MSIEALSQQTLLATGLQTAPDRAEPKLVLALPDWEKRRIVVASDEVIDGERLVCVTIQEPSAPAADLPEAVKVAGALQRMLDSQHCKVPVFDAQSLRQAIALLQAASARHPLTTPAPATAVQLCSIRDRECGDRPSSWFAECPKRQ